MNLDDILAKAGKNSEIIKDALKDSELRDKLANIVNDELKDKDYLIKAAEFVDKANSVLGPLEAGLRYFSALGTVGFGIYSLTKTLHYGLIKLPYLAYYSFKTKDYKGAGISALAELVKYVVPFGTAADILPINQEILEKRILNYSIEAMESYIKSEKGKMPLQNGIYRVKDNIKIHADLITKYHTTVSNGKVYMDLPSPGYKINLRRKEGGVHEIYLTRKSGVFPNILTTAELVLPDDVNVLKLYVEDKKVGKKIMAA
jgi:hypothetical protein